MDTIIGLYTVLTYAGTAYKCYEYSDKIYRFGNGVYSGYCWLFGRTETTPQIQVFTVREEGDLEIIE